MITNENKIRAKRNRTITVSSEEIEYYSKRCVKLTEPTTVDFIINKTINQNTFDILNFLPVQFVDLLFLDPPYNLSKTFNTNTFNELSTEEYMKWMDSWLSKLILTLKKTASIYICGDWRSSAAIQLLAERYFIIRNRITWEREKGRGAKTNWKNCSEDIWFCTMSDKYVFNVDSVKLKRKVIAPYTTDDGNPKDWEKTEGGNYRLTYPSNLWTDLTIPFWSMPENTDHPTQKPEKLLAKLILASSNENDIVLDPFLGSGTTSVVAKKLNRKYVGIEIDLMYCCLAEKRLERAEFDKSIQGYSDGVFWERNTFQQQRNKRDNETDLDKFSISLFEEAI